MGEETLSQNIAYLEILRINRYPALQNSLRKKSEERCQNLNQQFRMKSLEDARKDVSELSGDIVTLITQIEKSIQEQHRRKEVLTTQARHFYLAHTKSNIKNQVYTPYIEIRGQLFEEKKLIDIIHFLISHNISDLALFIYSYSYQPLQDVTVPNWPSILTALQTIINTYNWIKSVNAKWFTEVEFARVTSTLKFLATFIFNSKDFRYPSSSQTKIESPPFFNQFIPSIPSTDLSPSSFSQHSFKKILSLLGYVVDEVSGDGNCFFRAVVKSAVSNVSQPWENYLSLVLRQRTNPGNANRLMADGQPQDYPYREFTITNLNDSMIMSVPGTWADHVQVKKLADVLKVCFLLVMFDDKELHLSHTGLLIPGPDYHVGSIEDQKSSETSTAYSVGEKPLVTDPKSLYIHFCPSPGHYDSLRPPKIGGFQALLNSPPPPSSLGYLTQELASQPSYLAICQTYFFIQKQVDELVKSRKAGEGEIGELIEGLAILKTASKEVEKGELLNMTLDGPPSIFVELLLPINFDEISFTDAGGVKPGPDGPLSSLYGMIQQVRPTPPFSPAPSQNRTPSIIDSSVRFFHEMVQDLKKSIDPK
eukprot:TRINITY_DN10901_c0_g1_i1.p1 TRINITY_DN10901_c0_g1~~TRINITY_DN10901_c0_g1_i1.p1  ORF type:complete len:592 (-),score=117.17 TRINITY_DN10901_c0_g1_i1:105-1880(-)